MLVKGGSFQQDCQYQPCGKVIFEQRLEGEEVSHSGERTFRGGERREQQGIKPEGGRRGHGTAARPGWLLGFRGRGAGGEVRGLWGGGKEGILQLTGHCNDVSFCSSAQEAVLNFAQRRDMAPWCA